MTIASDEPEYLTYLFMFCIGVLSLTFVQFLFYNLFDKQECPEGYTCEKIVEFPCYNIEVLETSYTFKGVNASELIIKESVTYKNGTEIPRCQG